MAQTLPNGVVVPNADGGEAISETGVAEMRTLGASADSALAAKANTTYVDAEVDNAIQVARFARTNPGPFDFDTMKTPGTYSLGSPFPDGWTNVPEGITTASILNVYGSPSLSWCAQEVVQYGPNPKRLWRVSRTTTTWNPWIDISSASGGGSAMASNAAWQTRMVSATGGAVSTGGKAAFALRLDHGWTTIKAELRAGLIARGIVPGVATNSRNWAKPENSGTTPAEVNGWVAAGEFEILNHSATHAGGLDEASLVDEIVTGRIELEAQLPAAAPIWGFAPPGVTAGWDGFNGGNIDGWDTPAGRIILSSHAYSLGYVGGARRVLDGTIRQALSHITLDEYDLALARTQVDTAIAEGRGIQFMTHPGFMNNPGKITTAEFFSFLDYVVAKRDAGDLVILSPGELVRADATPPPAVSDVTGLAARLAAIEYDTDWRDVSADLRAGATGTVHIRRVGLHVHWRVMDLVPGTGHRFYWPPAGMAAPSSPITYPPQGQDHLAPEGVYLDNVGGLCRDINATRYTGGRWWGGTYVLPAGTPPLTTPPGDAVPA